MPVFDLYAAYYDLLYRDKDYSVEAKYVAALIRAAHPAATSILEMGCGTGAHALELVQLGFEVLGIDISLSMIEKASARRQAQPERAPLVDFKVGDVRSYRVARKFDAVVSLFHVMSYQTGNDDLRDAVRTARSHLESGGIFVFDFWYGPAVLTDRPKNAIKQVKDDHISVIRRTTPTLDVNRNRVDVRFDIEIRATDGECRDVQEVHGMRYLFLPEIEEYLRAGGFALEACTAWMSRSAPSDSSWYACAVARAE